MPSTRSTASAIPIWIADYVLSGYGTGAIMAVPAHDERDFEFAQKFGLPIRRVVAAPGTEADAPMDEAYIAHAATSVLVNAGEFDGMLADEGGTAHRRRRWQSAARPSPRSPTACATG